MRSGFWRIPVLLVILPILAAAAGVYFFLAEDGEHSGYIRAAYEADGSRFIEIDYMETLTGKAAAIRKLQDGDCLPEGGRTKEQLIEDILALEGSEDMIEAALYGVPGMSDCGSNGWWFDANDDPRTKTLKLALREPIVMAYDRGMPELGGFGPHEEIEFGRYEVSWETFQKIASGVGYDIPFDIKVAAGRVVSIGEIYRP